MTCDSSQNSWRIPNPVARTKYILQIFVEFSIFEFVHISTYMHIYSTSQHEALSILGCCNSPPRPPIISTGFASLSLLRVQWSRWASWSTHAMSSPPPIPPNGIHQHLLHPTADYKGWPAPKANEFTHKTSTRASS